ncbi:MAG: biopolymer transporter ExbD [Burkholderiaceae bacterium]|nr:MAG: biopolymer transporter ExbD [Burkholderiaceae bacterium]
MPFGGFDQNQHQAPIAEINTTPLVDVMLVLLVIFIITAPLLTSALKLDLPKADAPASGAAPDIITLAIDRDNTLFWNDEKIDAAQLKARLQTAAQQSTAPELHLRADKNTRYETIAQIIATAQQAGLQKIGFVTEAPGRNPRP